MKSASSWLIRIPPVDGEIFSSYLARTASANGLSPYRFYSFHFPGQAVWNRDIDRSASDSFVSGIALGANISAQTILAMTLRDFESVLQTPGTSAAIASWINVAGIYHRDRKGFAMQYCPHCLAANNAYLKIWRVSFVTVCEVHHCTLLDCCPHCGIQIAFHRTDAFRPNCHRCGRSLIHFSPSKISGTELHNRLGVQHVMLSALFNGKAFMGNQEVQPQEFFCGLALMMRAMKSAIRLARRRGADLPVIYERLATGQIEQLRITDRANQCLLLASLIGDWPNYFFEFAISHRLTQRTFTGRLPTWMHAVMSELPAGVPRIRQAVVVAPIRNQLRNLHRNKHSGWRTERAKLLLKKAGVGK